MHPYDTPIVSLTKDAVKIKSADRIIFSCFKPGIVEYNFVKSITWKLGITMQGVSPGRGIIRYRAGRFFRSGNHQAPCRAFSLVGKSSGTVQGVFPGREITRHRAGRFPWSGNHQAPCRALSLVGKSSGTVQGADLQSIIFILQR